MALTATIALTPSSTVPREQKVRALVTITNNTGGAVTITEIVPRIKSTALTFPTSSPSDGVGKCEISNTPIPDSTAVVYVFDVVFHAPSGGDTYSVDCLIYNSSSGVFSPSAATITVTGS